MTTPLRSTLARLLRGLALFGALALAAAGTAEAKTFKWASQGDPQTMDPYSQNEGLTNAINQHIYERLTDRDQTLKIVNTGLAERWETVSPLVWRFHLRKNVKFHDGTPFSADDVVFSIERAQHPNSQIAVYARAVGKPVKIDSHTVELRMEKFNPVLLDHLDAIFIMSRDWCVKHKVERPLSFKDKEETFASRNANGTGPFMLVSREPDVKTVLKRNPNYWGTIKGNVTEVIYTPIKSDATRTAALLSGELDMVLDPVPQDVQRIANGAQTKIVYGMENRVVFFGFDQHRDELLYSSVKGKNPFKDVRVRRAFQHAIDIQTIKEKVMRNQAEVVGCLTPSPIACAMAPELDRERLGYNLELARKLMEEAGYKDGFEVTLDCPNNRYINDEEICLAVASMMARINVKMKVNAMPRTTYFPKLEKYDSSMYMLGWGGAITDAQTTLDPVLHSRDDKSQKGFYNYGRYSDPKLDALIDAAAVETDPAKRRQLIKDALTLHNAEVRHIVLHRQMIPWAARKNVNPVHAADNYLRAWWVTID
jgi:peptide/nickel transport system substrate-binding protein